MESNANCVCPGGRRFSVTYPLLVKKNKGTFDYVWQNQVFSIENCPKRWKPGLDLALEVQESPLSEKTEWMNSHVEAEENHLQTRANPKRRIGPIDPPMKETAGYKSEECLEGADGNQRCSNGGSSADLGNRHSTVTESRSLDRTSQLPVSQHSADCSPDHLNFPSKCWWFEPTAPGVLPQNDAIVVDWTPIAMYEYIPSEEEVGAWLHVQEDYLKTSKGGKFLQHFRMPKGEDRTYAATAVPKSIWSQHGDDMCPLESIAKHALKIR